MKGGHHVFEVTTSERLQILFCLLSYKKSLYYTVLKISGLECSSPLGACIYQHWLLRVRLLTMVSLEGRKGGTQPLTSVTPLRRAESVALTQRFATRLGMLEPRHDTTEEREKHPPEQGACSGVKTMPGISALELFLKHTAVASTGSDQDISFVSFCCFSPCPDGAAYGNKQALQGTGHFSQGKNGAREEEVSLSDA